MLLCNVPIHDSVKIISISDTATGCEPVVIHLAIQSRKRDSHKKPLTDRKHQYQNFIWTKNSTLPVKTNEEKEFIFDAKLK